MKTEDRIVVAADVLAPGEFILDEMQERGWSVRILSEESGLTRNVITGLTLQHRKLKPGVAKKLGKVFGTSAEFWERLEAKYRFFKNQK